MDMYVVFRTQVANTALMTSNAYSLHQCIPLGQNTCTFLHCAARRSLEGAYSSRHGVSSSHAFPWSWVTVEIWLLCAMHYQFYNFKSDFLSKYFHKLGQNSEALCTRILWETFKATTTTLSPRTTPPKRSHCWENTIFPLPHTWCENYLESHITDVL